MLIPEAVALVLKAGCTAKGGEIFVLDMGTPVKIAELAENMIKLSGYKLNVDIEVKFTGLREGEKLYEELLIDDEGITKTEDDLIYIAKPTDIDNVGLFTKLAELEDNIENISKFDIIDRIADIVSTYHANNSEYNEYKQGVGIID
jgi:FlaA1/EpsC-like NDP-sugar epimerase